MVGLINLFVGTIKFINIFTLINKEKEKSIKKEKENLRLLNKINTTP
jgi:hypothetical protein